MAKMPSLANSKPSAAIPEFRGKRTGVGMTILEDRTWEPLDYQYCHYGSSRLSFRGPERDTSRPYIAVLGGSETFGKYVAHPYGDQLEEWIGQPVLNLGAMHAGVTAFLHDGDVLKLASEARLTVLQVPGAQNMSNRLYSVHARRNDRFLGASPALRDLFPGVDFIEYNFTGHLLSGLQAHSPEAFAVLVQELRASWLARMRQFLRSIHGNVLLLWMSERTPDEQATSADGVDPMFVDRGMLDALMDDCAGLVEVVASKEARAEGLSGKSFGPDESEAAATLPGPLYHAEVAEALAGWIGHAWGPKWKSPRRARAFPRSDRSGIRASR
jgi:Domain of unknown function (DUF6473)